MDAQNSANPTAGSNPNSVSLQQAQDEAALLDAKTKLELSRQAYMAAQQGSAAAAQQAAVDAADKLTASQKSTADNQAAILKDKFSVPDSGYTGSVQVGLKAGSMESTLLAAKAVQVAATQLTAKLPPQAKGTGVLLYSLDKVPTFEALITFDLQASLLETALDRADTNLSTAVTNAPKPPAPRATEGIAGAHLFPVITPAEVGAAFEAANKLLGFFRTDYSIQGVDVTPDDLLLTHAVAQSVTAAGWSVQMPQIYAPILLKENPVLTRLLMLAEARTRLEEQTSRAQKQLDALSAAALATVTPEVREAVQKGITSLTQTIAAAKAATGLYDSFFTQLTTSEKAAVPLVSVVQQDAARRALDNGALLLTVKLASAGGSYFTKKNILTGIFGGMPFWNMGAVVATYSLFDGKSGVVLASGVLPVEVGYVKTQKLQDALR